VLFAGFAPGDSNAAMVNPRITALLRSPRPDREWHSGELETAMVLADVVNIHAHARFTDCVLAACPKLLLISI
jgi:hypothetical protein